MPSGCRIVSPHPSGKGHPTECSVYVKPRLPLVSQTPFSYIFPPTLTVKLFNIFAIPSDSVVTSKFSIFASIQTVAMFSFSLALSNVLVISSTNFLISHSICFSPKLSCFVFSFSPHYVCVCL